MRVLEDRQAIWPYILVSLLVHILLVLLVRELAPVLPTLAEKPIEVIPVEEIPQQAQHPMRIADIAEPKQQAKPKTPKFLGMYDSAVPEETVAVRERPGKSGDAGKQQPKPSKPAEPPTLKKMMRGGTDRLLAFDKHLFDDKPSKVEEVQRKQRVSIGDGGTTADFFPDFKRGGNTYLNVLRYPDVEYFVRLKRAFRMTFNPEPSLRDYFTNNRVTRGSVDVVLGVSVDRMGNLAELFVFRGSGIPTYDQEAMRTVRASSPFAVPPAKFTDNDGVLRMTWTFTVYL